MHKKRPRVNQAGSLVIQDVADTSASLSTGCYAQRGIYHHIIVLPAFAAIVLKKTSDAKRTMNVPPAEGVYVPSIVATFKPGDIEDALDAAGRSKAAAAPLVVEVVEVKV